MSANLPLPTTYNFETLPIQDKNLLYELYSYVRNIDLTPSGTSDRVRYRSRTEKVDDTIYIGYYEGQTLPEETASVYNIIRVTFTFNPTSRQIQSVTGQFNSAWSDRLTLSYS